MGRSRGAQIEQLRYSSSTNARTNMHLFRSVPNRRSALDHIAGSRQLQPGRLGFVVRRHLCLCTVACIRSFLLPPKGAGYVWSMEQHCIINLQPKVGLHGGLGKKAFELEKRNSHKTTHLFERNRRGPEHLCVCIIEVGFYKSGCLGRSLPIGV